MLATTAPVEEKLLLFDFRKIAQRAVRAIFEAIVIGGGDVEQLKILSAEAGDRAHSIWCTQRNVLYPGPAIVLQKFLNLRVGRARFVDRQLKRSFWMYEYLAT